MSSPAPLAHQADFDVDDAWLLATGTAKWRVPPPGVIPAWVAEMDVRGCPAVVDAVTAALHLGCTGYADLSAANGLADATATMLLDRFDLAVSPGDVVATGDVMAGVRLALEALCDDAPVVVPVPTYPPFLHVVPLAGRRLVTVPLTYEAGVPVGLDLDAIEAALRAGARTVLLASPHNPSGLVFSAEQLSGLRDVVAAYGGRVLSDEIHAPLVLEPGLRHRPMASIEGAADMTVSVFAASKAWNVAGLKCAQIVTTAPGDRGRLSALPHVANGGTSPLGIVATVAAYRDGGPWLDSVVERLRERREQLVDLMAAHLPGVVWTPPQATYLAWLDASAYARGPEWDAARAAIGGGVMLSRGTDFAASPACARLNLATSAERLERIVRRLAAAWAA